MYVFVFPKNERLHRLVHTFIEWGKIVSGWVENYCYITNGPHLIYLFSVYYSKLQFGIQKFQKHLLFNHAFPHLYHLFSGSVCKSIIAFYIKCACCVLRWKKFEKLKLRENLRFEWIIFWNLIHLDRLPRHSSN